MSDPQATLLDQQCSGASAGERVCWSFKSRVSGVGGGEERGESGGQKEEKGLGKRGGERGGSETRIFLTFEQYYFQECEVELFSRIRRRLNGCIP